MEPDGVEIACGELPGLLREPPAGVPVRGGVVALPGAAVPQRRQPMFDHLATTLGPLGYSVLSFDRRPWAAADGSRVDTPLEVQATDALTAVAVLRDRIRKPVGLFGFSQGAWSAALAASQDPTVAFLVLVGCSGVSPAEQMRFYTDELLRRSGYGESARSDLRRLRLALEELLRGRGDREEAGRFLDEAVHEPWFDLAYLDRDLPEQHDSWLDMDYDPEPTFEGVRCPTLLVYGEDEECVPPERSKEAWRRATEAAGRPGPTIVDVPDCGHVPAPGADASSSSVPVAGFSPVYTDALGDWLAPRAAPGPI